jgi:hypothetical protein
MELGFFLTGMTTVAAVVWATVAYVVFGLTDRLPVARTPMTNAAILIGGGFVAPVIVLTTVLAFVMPLTAAGR